MNIGNQIKLNREKLNLSQEELAEKIYVSRQTISNWENNKNYPDINSLVLLSKTFDVSVDSLLKGDIEEMKEIVSQGDVRKFKTITNIFGIEFFIMIISVVPLFYYLEFVGMCIWVMFVIVAMLTAVYLEKFKKKNDIQSYKEILAFLDGKKLDEIHKKQEIVKRPYQKILLAIGSAVISLIIGLILIFAIK